MKSISILLFASVLTAIGGCTWVSANPEVKQKGVMVLPQERVGQCRLLSKTQVSVADRIGFINRVQSDVEKDLQNLAMNQAVSQGGDTVSALAPEKDGNQTFGIYKCLGAPTADQTTKAPAASTKTKTTPYKPPR
ncbi:MAG: hypothetical protein KGL13_05465 [Gammaproteobacteria bacterium]|nr:hypothetical protein [Gammaproteobacteria bacterium]MDE2345897.1 hypothetical protein [Gammaproteobacteria bacterium]